MSDQIDNAAAAALFMLGLTQPVNVEHIGAIYRQGDGYNRTPTVTTGDQTHTQGKLSVPPGTLAALFHNHPAFRADSHNARLTGDAAKFSDDDVAMAKRVGVPSYISAPDGRVLRFDSTTNKTEEVLAEFPIHEMRLAIALIIKNSSFDQEIKLQLLRNLYGLNDEPTNNTSRD